MRKSVLAISIMSIIFSNSINANDIKSIKIGGYIIPPAFVMALEEGMSVPVFLRLNDAASSNQSEDKIADAVIVIEHDKIKLASIHLIDSTQGPQLNSLLIETLEKKNNVFFDENSDISIDSNATLKLNISSFNLSLDVDKAAFSPKERVRRFSLGDSSVNRFSAVANYDLGVFQSHVKNAKNSSSSYFNLDTLFAAAEHHININASAYSIGKSNSNVELYRAMYERDFNGLRFALGLMSTWNLQSIASLTTLSSSKIYAASIGNHSSSVVANKQQSLTPIYAFLNSPGEVRIYRQGKLLNIQNFPMGNYEVDTSVLPYGIYDVTIETVVDGKVVTTQNQTINKSFGAIGRNFDKTNWELYGGYVDFDKKYYVRNENSHSQSPEKSYLLGISIARSFPVLSGLSLTMSNYGFDKFFVNETSINVALNEYISLSWQGMMENHGSHRNIGTVSLTIPEGYGSLWASREKTVIKGDLPLYDADSYSYGGTFNFDKIIDRAGTFTISNTKDRRVGSDSINYEYGNTLFSGRYGTVGLRAGVQRYHYDNQSSTNEKYINLDFSLPLSTWLSTGVSSTNGNIKANIYANKNFEDSPITNAGLSVSKLVRDKNNGESDFSTLAYASYDMKYNSGTITVNRPDGDRLNGNLTSRGSIAYSDGTIMPSGQQGKSGIIINSAITGNGSMVAKVNGQNYPISGKNTFIPLSPYSDYEIQLMNDGKSKDSFDIISGRNKSVTLYPGNVAFYQPEVRQLVTVFGRLKSPDGEFIKYASIRNHIGRTRTDKNGEFSMDVDVRYPVISLLQDDEKTICEADLNLEGARGALWVGDVTCEPQSSLAKR
ncbi:CS1-pili formation C-terminal domain-containing protein [Providencia vermicola]|uniref:CS1-pili formation C-terminal domain-containing protein n=1 Tax=Providencia vermicola TaxID=333965 RepID=A0AAX3S1J7_9GAMM|nr:MULTISPECIES: CS1-pili formation C-terminal domain-containing protein [Providencia]ELX8380779.1 CS1-pili formation C-terminal domain-containing protein [Providencia stuartii]EMD5260317.1 CS1-pili formation C-terminal domain-containing protein [Providencia stuartii]USB38647.1 CS1-pili formation C-terminal domain-containing protein [Providencia vermicola]WFC07684.1 CS1-pili formation C-terminal domain-containing protein [Providencia vermicola]